METGSVHSDVRRGVAVRGMRRWRWCVAIGYADGAIDGWVDDSAYRGIHERARTVPA